MPAIATACGEPHGEGVSELYPVPDARPTGRRCRVAIVADDALGLSRASEAVAAADADVAWTMMLRDDLLEQLLVPDAMIVELQSDHGAPLDALLDHLQQAAVAGDFPSVVTVPPALIDVAMARAPHPNVQILSETDPIARAATLAIALSLAPRARVAEEAAGASELARLSAEAARIATALARLSGSGWHTPVTVQALPPTEGKGDAARFRRMVRQRRLRDRLFGDGLFADPAWDMLLDLAAARLEKRQVAVSSLCIAAAVPPSTALRWIKTLIGQGLFLRVDDPLDGRRAFVALSDRATAAMQAYLEAMGVP